MPSPQIGSKKIQGANPRGAAGPHSIPADRRPALSADAAGARLLLVPPRDGCPAPRSDQKKYRARIPVELRARPPSPPIGDLPYLLTLPAHAFYWFRLATDAQP